MISARCQFAEWYSVDTGLQIHPCIAVECIGIADALRTVKLHGREFDAERVVFVRQVELVGIRHRGCDNIVASGFHAQSYRFIVHVKVCDAYFRVFVGACDFSGVKVGNTTGASKDNFSLGAGKWYPFAEFISLQAVACIEIDKCLCTGIEAGYAEVRTYP